MNRLALKRAIGMLWPSDIHTGKKIVLLYHSVGNTPWAMAEEIFNLQLEWLSENAKIVTLTELLNNRAESEVLQVALTLDDGYQNLHDTVAPRLKEYKVSATVFINTGWIEADAEIRKASDISLGHYPGEHFMIWPEVKSLHEAGWEIGSHGVNHYNFTEINKSVTQYELEKSKEQIEDLLNINCLHFAYPFGRYSDTVKQLVKIAGYQYAMAARHGCLRRSKDLYAIPRINIEKNYSLKDFQQILLGKWDYLNLIHKFRGI